MQHRYPSFITVLLIIFFMAVAGNSQAQDQVVVTGAGTTAVNGSYTYGGTSNGKPYYTKGNYKIEYFYDMYVDEFWWEIYDITISNWSRVLYYNSNTSSNTPVMAGWFSYYGDSPDPTISNGIVFTGGTAYTAPWSPTNSTNNPIGRFFLDAATAGATMTSLTLQLTGSISQISNVKLWSSADNAFSAVGDAQLSSKTAAASVTFNSLSSAISSAGTYYFITADVIAGGYGHVSTKIANAAAFTVSGGSISTSITNAALSSGAATLPLHLLTFTAHAKEHAVTLDWMSAKEENFSGFEVERSVDGTEWFKLAFVPGNTNSVSTVSKYTFTDNKAVVGNSYYRLKMVDIDGSFTYSKLLAVKTSNETRSLQSYPNPFTQSASIAFQIPVSSFTTLKVYNAMGVEVSTLMNKQLDAGSYSVAFDGASLPAGLYMYTLKYGKEVLSGTMLKK